MSHQFINPDQFKKPTLIGQATAKIIAIVLGISAAFFLLVAIVLSVNVLFGVGLAAFGLYLMCATFTFLITRSWKDGTSVREALMALGWPKAIWDQRRAGVSAMASAFRGVHISASEDDSPTLIKSEGWSILTYLAIGVVGSVLLRWGLGRLDGLFGEAILIIFAFLLVCVAFAWAMGWPYTGGMTGRDIMLKLIFPLGIAVGVSHMLRRKFRTGKGSAATA